MAYLFERPRSPFWWVGWNLPDGDRAQESTNCKVGSVADKRRAELVKAQKEVLEKAGPANGIVTWAEWVPAFLQQKYAASPKTLNRMCGAWRTLAVWLEFIGVHGATKLRREHCLAYTPWRQKSGHMNARGRAGKITSHNTALLELKILGIIMNEAVLRHYIELSPTWKLGLKKIPPAIKQEIGPEHRAMILEEIERVRLDDPVKGHFLSVSFEIASAQGWRLHETYIDLGTVDLRRLQIYRVSKGGKSTTSNINPILVPLFRRLIAEGREFTYEQPKIPSMAWFDLFWRLRKKDPSLRRISFHSTRVTVVSDLLNAGIPQPDVMHLVEHSSTVTQRIYRRLSPSAAARAWKALNDPVSPHEPGIPVVPPEKPGSSSESSPTG